MNKEHFNVNVDSNIQQVQIFLNTNKYKDSEVNILIKDDINIFDYKKMNDIDEFR